MNRLILGMVLVALASAVPAAANEVYFIPDISDVTSGEMFFVEMRLNSTEGIDAFQAEIYFNSAVVNITDAISGDYSNLFGWNNLGDCIRVVGLSENLEEYPPGNYLLANFTLVADNNGASPLHYNTNWGRLGNASYGIVAATWNDGTVRIDTTDFPPNTPNKPSGPTYGINGTSYTYSTSATDPDEDLIKYGWDWNGDGTVDEWTNLMASGTTDIRSHSWMGGRYSITVKAKDEHGAESAWSNPLSVHINTPPNTPSEPSGPTSGVVGGYCFYSISTADLDGDRIRYGWDWNGDDTVDEWTNLQSSGTTAQIHFWTEAGTYDIKVKAKDEHDEESTWSSPLTVDINISARIRITHHYGDTSDYNGVPMFNLMEAVPEGTSPLDLLQSVADVTMYEGRVYSINGITESPPVYWYLYINGIPAPDEDIDSYQLRDGEVVHWDYSSMINAGSENAFRPYSVMDYPAMFVHGYGGCGENIAASQSAGNPPESSSTDLVIAKIRVRNNGTGDAENFEILVLLDGVPYTVTTVSVAAKAAKFIYLPVPRGYNVTVMLDPKNIINESDETDNEATKLS